MSKKPVKKTAAKPAGKNRPVAKTKSTAKKATKNILKKKSLPGKTGTTGNKKTVISDKEREIRAANLIANTEKKKRATVSGKKRPKKSLSEQQTTTLLDAIVEGMRERKAKNIAILDLTKIENRVTDYFVICDADSKTHVEAIADSVEEIVYKLTSEKAFHSEGHENSEWILIDYINVVAHVFLREVREHYNIEALWGDAEMKLIND